MEKLPQKQDTLGRLKRDSYRTSTMHLVQKSCNKLADVVPDWPRGK